MRRALFLLVALITLLFAPATVRGGGVCSSGCSAGSYYSSCSLSCVPCPAGYTCKGGLPVMDVTTQPKACAAGTYKASTGSGSCVSCPAGTASQAGASACSPCPFGQRASAGLCVNCPNGYIASSATTCSQCSPQTYASTVTGQCEPCTYGYACPSRTVDKEVTCGAGSYVSSATGACVQCEAGYACPSPIQGYPGQLTPVVRVACMPGTYSAAGASSCSPCEVMRTCPSIATTDSSRGTCSSGWYATGGAISCTVCPAGYQCPASIVGGVPEACPAGTYSYEGATACTSCGVGMVCPTTTTTLSCPLGSYVPNVGATSCSLCPAGSYCATTSSAPVPCPAGTYSNAGQSSCTPCPSDSVAWYAEGTGNTACTICPFYSSCTTTAKTDCPRGTFSMAGAFFCSSCATTYGSVATYTVAAGSPCLICPPGSSCTDPAVDPVPCALGSYSLGGSSKCTSCPPGSYCPNRAAMPVPCPYGSYSLGGNITCELCPIDSGCPNRGADPVPCDVAAGFYSPLGDPVCHFCPPGKTCTNTPSSNVTSSACPIGTYRTDGSTLSCQACPPGHYCPYSNLDPIVCPEGTYSWFNATNCTICPAGSSCLNRTVAHPCPLGYFSLAGSVDCKRCPEGYRCPVTNLEPILCPAGSFSEGLSTNCTVCPPGFECPSTSQFVGAAKACVPGTFSVGGQIKCSVCPAGFICPSTTASTMTPCTTGTYSYMGAISCTACPAGFMCPSTDGSFRIPTRCPPGSFSNGSTTSCTVCSAGYMCPFQDIGIVTPCPAGTFSAPGSTACTDCAPGYYCPLTAVTDTMPQFGAAPFGRQIPCGPGNYSSGRQTACFRCPIGYYCTSTTAMDGGRLRCPAGYLPGIAGAFVASSATECVKCPTGSQCTNPNAAPAACSLGTYATEGTCFTCPAGYYCPTVDREPISCPAGTYSSSGATACTQCNPGFLCTAGSTTPTPTDRPCPLGSYCPQGSVVPILCPAGTMGLSQNGVSEASACTDCLPGYTCPAGTAGVSAMNSCPEGFYCPAGSPFPTPCPAGTHSNDQRATSRASCTLCPEGYFCPAGTARYAANPCPPGFFCPAGTGNGFDNGCPIGTYSPEYKAANGRQCFTCPAGHYCPIVGLTTPVPCAAGTYQPEPGSSKCLLCVGGWACTSTGMTGSFLTTCSPGHYCPPGTADPDKWACPGGSFTRKTNLASADECNACWRGYGCPPGTGQNPTIPQDCLPGYYCPGAPPADNGQDLTLAQYPGVTSSTQREFPCPPGTYSPQSNLYEAAQCSTCPAGSFCAGGLAAPNGLCAAGYYCPPGSSKAKEVPCKAGTYSNLQGLVSQDDCTPCQPGYYCVEAATTMTPCPAGSYTPYNLTFSSGPSGLESSRMCLQCPAGYYCAAGSKSPTSCASGQFSDMLSSSCSTCTVGHYCPHPGTSTDQMRRVFECPAGLYCPVGFGSTPSMEFQACPVGHYCPRATVAPIACPIGTFNPNLGRSSLADCQECTQGYYCDSPGLSAVTGECDPGHYCPSGSSSPQEVPCPVRYYRAHPRGESEDFCSVCPRGYYCTEGTANPIPCTKGYYCVAGSETPQPCPIGTFGNTTHLKSQDECTACTAGYYCDGLGLPEPTGLCDPGYFCISRAFSCAPTGLPTGGLCPKGGYCPAGSSFPTACAEGTFNNFTGGSTQDDCVACTPGYYCSGSNLPYPTGPCTAGYYCTGGASLPTQFRTPAGHYSPAGSPAPIECPLGTFNPSPAQATCEPCIAGYYCPTRSMTTYLPCTVGSYCPAASVLPRACPRGTYQPDVRMTNLSNCVYCSPGKYCLTTNLSQPTGLCDSGFYCKRSCVTSDCSFYSQNYAVIVNTIPNPGLVNEIGGLCPWGHFCPNGTAHPSPCPVGTVRDDVGARSSTDCQACPATYYCPSTGTSRYLVDNAPVECAAGYYCPGPIATSGPGMAVGCADSACSNHQGEPCINDYIGCANNDANFVLSLPGPRKCPKGFYCPPKSQQPTKCGLINYGKSTYQDQMGQGACHICPRGKWCDPSDLTSIKNPVDCPAGRYCPFGTSINQPRCPPGAWSDEIRLQNVTQCKLCPPGRFCPYAGVTTQSTYNMPFCLGGYWCQTGAKDGYGNVGMLGGMGGPCLPGYYCPNGTKSNASYACRPGTYKPTYYGADDLSCIVCPAGMYCTGSAQPSVTGRCVNGYYCPYGCEDRWCGRHSCQYSVTPWQMNWRGGPCPYGHYCASSTAVGPILPTACPDGMYQDELARDTCKACPAGFYCYNASSLPIACGVGNYCPPRTTRDNVTSCPTGTYNSFPRATSLTQCLLCPAGRYCPNRGMNSTALLCDPGVYCSSGAAISNGTLGTQGGETGVCPAGHYCLAGTVKNTSYPCPPGTFNPLTGARNSTACQACTPGFYCQGWGNNKVSGPCANGFYCPTSCQDKYCSNTPCSGNCAHPTPYMVPAYAEGGVCPSGHYCAQSLVGGVLTGAIQPTMCVNGTYAPDSGSSNCTLCPAGSWCGMRETRPQTCPAGYYCLAGSIFPTTNPCPIGTYAPTVNNTGIAACAACLGGRYCPSAGMSAPGPNCSAGYYCTRNAIAANGTFAAGGAGGSCPVGYFCPSGTITPTEFACPAGTYQPFTHRTNSTACLSCSPGFYCPQQNQSQATLWCASGYYCPSGCADSQCMNKFVNGSMLGGPCPTGYICPQEATRGATFPTACAAGTFSPTLAGTSCSACPAGFYCTPGSTIPIPCPAGRYCPGNTDMNAPRCPPGSYTDATGSSAMAQCKLCGPGSYCPIDGSTTVTAPCNPGYYCISGAATPNGTVGILGGSTGVCPAGYYCPVGTRDPKEYPCPAGTYNPITGAVNASQCLRCLPGYYCNGTGKANATDVCAGGFYCPGGCVDPQCSNAFPYGGNCSMRYGGACPIGFYCPTNIVGTDFVTTAVKGLTNLRGSITPIACSAGFYSPDLGAAACGICPAGYYCLQGREDQPHPIACPAGAYCPAGTGSVPSLCPAGTYSNRIGLNSSADCLWCTPSRSCPSPGMTAPGSLCARGYYCIDGAIDIYGRLGVRGGTISPFSKDAQGRAVCPAGYYCPAGSAYPLMCPPGTYNPNTGGYNSTFSCLPCTGGYHCETAGLTTPTGQCLAGYVCPGGCADQRCYSCPRGCRTRPGGDCPVAHYCPTGTATPIPCPAGTSSNFTAAATCEPCPAAFYCPIGSLPITCPVGRYCPAGTSDNIPACPAGSFSNMTSRITKAECTLCPATQACTVAGLTAPDSWCDAGYHCISGASTVTAVVGELGGVATVCPAGNYCPPRTSAPIPCPAGTFNPLTKGTNISACVPCTPGSYCATTGLSAPTDLCDASFYCIAGQSVKSPSGGVCPTGHYCPRGSVSPTLCPAGTYNPVTLSAAVSSCLPCAPGYYCNAGSSNSTAMCLAGYYCTGGSNSSTPNGVNGGPCMPGYYCPAGSSSMRPCSAGKYCSTMYLPAPTANCTQGYFCIGGALTATPTDGMTGNVCPVGTYCPSGSSSPVKCPVGTFNPLTTQPYLSSCVACTAGYYCPNEGQSAATNQCSAGYYCPAGQSVATPPPYLCPRGFYCVVGSPGPIRCLSGYYQDVPGSTSCKNCPAGSYCRQDNLCPGFNFTMPTPCPAGSYCLQNTQHATQYMCPPGTFSSDIGMSSSSTCKACPPGVYCPTPGMTTPGPNCSAGYYCINGSNTSSPSMPAGSICPAGYYCPSGADTPLPCPAGTFSSSLGLGSIDQCKECLPGHYCSGTALTNVSGKCAAGFYCPGGEVSATPVDRVCPYGHICAAGSAFYQPCPSGMYAPGTGLSACQLCNEGTYCDMSMPCDSCPTVPCVGNYTCPRNCPLGHYCLQGTHYGTQYPCPAGRYGNQPSLTNASACVTCPPGQYCPHTGMSVISSLYCQPGYYCIGGASVSNPNDNTTGAVCPPGAYCPRGSPSPTLCPSGTYQPSYSATNITACIRCTPGYACSAFGLSSPNAICQGGYYCPGGATSPSMPQYLCTIGNYCPVGATSPIVCPSGEWALNRGLERCNQCEAGFYCNQNETCPGSNVSKPVPCLVGHYCPAGTLNGDQYPCPIGTHNDRRGLRAFNECTSCPPGKVCPVPGMSTNLVDCGEGYYCIGGANVTNPMDGVTGDQCPPGFYCPAGVAAPIGCPQGTYSNVSGLWKQSQCSNCSAGMYCSSIGLTKPTGYCDAGFYCPGGMIVPNPVGYECWGGKYCPIGTGTPLDCQNGTYVPGNLEGRATCFLCPPGFFCNIIEQQLSPYNRDSSMVIPVYCPRGYYCPQGTAYQIQHPCPSGTFSNVTGLAAVSECWDCTAGHFCLLPGRTAVTGICSAGYYCAYGVNTSQPSAPAVSPFRGGVCPSGFFCPAGSGPEGIPCPPGTFFGGIGATNRTWCKPCRPGYFCPTSRTTVDTGAGQCSAGHYCPGGDSISDNPSFRCPPGYYCPTGSAQPIPCPGGSYQPVAGSSVCTFCPEYYFCPRGSVNPTICFKSHVCPAGVAYPAICPNGTYAGATTAAMKSISECAICPAGVYCTNGTVTGPCAAGYLCEFGNSVPDPSYATDIPNRKKGGLCPLGHYCTQGTTYKRPCTNQTVGFSEGLQAATDCSPCRPGYYCVESSVLPIDCLPGYYCPGYTTGKGIGLIPCPVGTYNPSKWATDLSWCVPCRQGYYCPVTAMTAPYTYPTPPGYYSAPGQSKPYPCPGGTYQPTSGRLASNTSACMTCPAGYYCGPQSASWNQSCPEGTFCPPGTTYPFHCPGGHFCPHRAIEPLTCPPGSYCPPLSTYPRVCWNGTYCPASTEIPLLCPNGYVSSNTTVSRKDVEEACDACVPGYWSTNSIYCDPCTAGYVCVGATSTEFPLNITEDGGYICPVGHYCPTGSSRPTPCPIGTFNNQTGGRTIDACYRCPRGFYQPKEGTSYCVRCGVTSESTEGSSSCKCLGANREFQAGDGSCRCKPGYVFYSDGHRLSEDDSAEDCIPKIFERCAAGLVRTSLGECVSSDNPGAPCEFCVGGKGRMDPTVGICLCDTLSLSDTVCNETCVQESNKIMIDTASNSIVHYEPSTGATLSIDLDSSGILGERRCAAGRATCEVQMLRLSPQGSQALFNPPSLAVTSATTAPQSQSTRRQMAQQADPTGLPATPIDKTLANPIICLNFGDAVLWDVSDPSRAHFPVYQKDNLLNTNPTFDYTSFRELAEKVRAPNLTVRTFMYTFDNPGVYVFQDNANPNSLQILRVVSPLERCPTVRFNAITGQNLVTLGIKRDTDLTLAPDWILIGVLLGGLFLLIAGLIGGLWHFRRQTWGIIGTALPRYRSLGMQALGNKSGSVLRGGGGEDNFVIPPYSSNLITLRLETPTREFVPADFIAVIAAEAGVDAAHVLIMSITEDNATVKFVLCDPNAGGSTDADAAARLLVSRIADTTNDIHTKLPILACEEVGDADNDRHPAYHMADIEDDLWDYEREVDLEGFNVRTLYDKLEDQTIHIVSQLTNQRDDLLLLCDKILVESEALKDMFVRIRVDIDDNNRAEKELIESRDAKISSGNVDFDLPDDLKYGITRWLENFFADNMGTFLSNVKIVNETRVEEPVRYEYENVVVVQEEQPDGSVVTKYVKRDVVAEEALDGDDDEDADGEGSPLAGAAAADGIDENMFKTIQKAPRQRIPRSGHQLTEEQETETRARVRKLQKTLPQSIQDDSDCEGEERAVRAEKREAVLTRRVRRLRRAMDYLTMPTALEEISPRDGVVSAAQAESNARLRNEWLASRRRERAQLDAVPEEIKDDPTLPADERRKRQLLREAHLVKRAQVIAEVIESLDVPDSMKDDPALEEPEREARRIKRDKFIKVKLEKAARNRAETMVPMLLDDESDVEPSERARRREDRNFIASELVGKNPQNSPSLPDPFDEKATPAQKKNRSEVLNEIVARRVMLARAELALADEDNGVSDHSDLDESERARRAQRRADVASKKGIVITETKDTMPQQAAPSLAEAMLPSEFKYSESDRMPKEYLDDEDLDDEDRAARRRLRKAFKQGRAAKPSETKTMLEDENAPNISDKERAQRHAVNMAFSRGKDARNANAAAVVASRAAKSIVAEAEEMANEQDEDLKSYFEAGKKIDKDLEMPAEYSGNDVRARRLQAAFNMGKIMQTLGEVPAELGGLDAADGTDTALARKARDPLVAAARAAAAKAFEVPPELEDSPHLAADERERRTVQRKMHARGAQHRSDAEMKEEIERVELDESKRRTMMNAYKQGKVVASEGKGMSLPTELRDDLPFLSDEEVARRRVLQTYFMAGHRSQQAEKELSEMLEDASIPTDQKNRIRAAFEAGRKARIAAGTIPEELREKPGMSVADRKEIVAKRSQYAKTVHAALTSELMARELLEIPTLTTKERREITNALRRGREAQKVADQLPEELQDSEEKQHQDNTKEGGKSATAADIEKIEEAKLREARRRALTIGRMARMAASVPQELAEPEDIMPEETAAAASGLASVAREDASKKAAASKAQPKGAVPVAEEEEPAATEMTPAKEAALKDLNKQARRQFGQLKARQQAESTAVIEELEADIKLQKEKTIAVMSDAFVRERKIVAERQAEELDHATEEQREATKQKHLEEMRKLQADQQVAKAELEAEAERSAEEKREKINAVLEAKAKAERTLTNSLFQHQNKEIARMKDDAVLAMKAGDLAREADLAKQRDALAERLKNRERRTIAKFAKERDILNNQLKETEAIERDSLTTNITVTKARMIERAKKHITNPQDLAEEVERIERTMGMELENQMAVLDERLRADRTARETGLKERQAAETKALSDAAMVELNELIEAKKRIVENSNNDGTEVLSENAKKAVELLIKQQQIKEEVEKQRKETASASAGIDIAKVKLDATREIKRREQEAGAKMSNEERQAILEEYRQSAVRLAAAMNDNMAQQKSESERRLAERRRKRELEDIKTQLAQQEEEQRKRNAELAKRLAVKPISAELPPEVIAAEEQIDNRMNRAKENLRRKQEEEAARLNAQMEEDLKKFQEKELEKLKKEADRKRLELLSHQSAKEGMAMSEEARTQLMKAHEAEARTLQDQIDNEAAQQRARLAERIAQHKRKKLGELEEKQRAETISEVAKHEQEKDAVIRQAKLEHERKAYEEAVKKAQGTAKAEEVAEVVMSERHRQERQDLLARQEKRKQEEREIREQQFEALKAEGQAYLEKRRADINAMPVEEAERTKLFAEHHQRVKEREKKHALETQARMDELDALATEEQLQLKTRQWDDVARTVGLKAPEEALKKYQAKVALRNQGQADAEAEDELAKMREAHEKASAALAEQMKKEKEGYEKKLKEEMERMKREQEERVRQREAALEGEMRRETERKQRKLQEAHAAAAKSGKVEDFKAAENMEKRIRDEAEENERRAKEILDKERAENDRVREELLRKKREKKALLAAGSDGTVSTTTTTSTTSTTKVLQAVQANLSNVAVPVAALGVGTTSSTSNVNNYTVMQGAPQFTFAPGQGQAFGFGMPPSPSSASTAYSQQPMAYAPSMLGAHYQQWVNGVVAHLDTSPIMERLRRIEKLLAAQSRTSMVSFYLDAKDRAITNEGVLTPLPLESLTNAQIIVYVFAESVREKLEMTGIELPKVEICAAKSLPATQMGATSFRNSYHYDANTRKLYVRDTRLSSIGEFVLVTFHAMAHIKAAALNGSGQPSWNDADPAFLSQFYGLLEVCAEEMFYMRLNPTKACRDEQRGRGFRTADIMSKDSFEELEQQLEQLGDERTRLEQRQNFLKMYFEF